MSKISAYLDGGALQATDKLVVARAGVNKSILGSNVGGGGSPSVNDGRLTLESTVPISITDQTSKTTLYFTPYVGNKLGLYNGSTWDIVSFAELSITLASLTAGKPYDVFIYNNSGTATLELLAWTNTTTRATALARQDGIWCKTGALTRRYIGTICIVATGQCEDSSSRRMVWNYYNRVPRIVVRLNTSNHAYSTAAWRAWNNSAANSQVEFVLGEATNIMGIYRANNTVAGGGVGFGVNTTGGPSGTKGEQFNNAQDAASADLFAFTAGYNYWVAVEYGGGSFNTERISLTMQVEG